MKKKDAIAHFGDVATLASTLRVSPQAVYQWGEDVPETSAYKLEVITEGALRAMDLANCAGEERAA